MLLDMTGDMAISDWVLVPVCFASILLYHVYYCYRLLRHPDQVSLGVNLIEGGRWVKRMMRENMNGAEILGVQTLRNLSSGASFLSSATITTAVLLFGSLMTQSANSITNSGIEMSLYWQIRLAILVACLFGSVLCFALCIRTSTHASFLVCLKQPNQTDLDNLTSETESDDGLHSWLDQFVSNRASCVQSHGHVIQSAVSMVGRSTTTFFIGIRLLFLVVPLATWLIGAYGLLAGTCILIPIFA